MIAENRINILSTLCALLLLEGLWLGVYYIIALLIHLASPPTLGLAELSLGKSRCRHWSKTHFWRCR